MKRSPVYFFLTICMIAAALGMMNSCSDSDSTTQPVVNNTPEIISGELTQDKTLPYVEGKYYIVEEDLNIRGTAKLIIQPGVKIVFKDQNSQIVVEENAGIQMIGTADKHIVLTSPATNNNPGAWAGVQINSGRNDNIMKYVDIVNAGEDDGQAVYLTGNEPRLSMENCTISYSKGWGIVLGYDSKLLSFKNNVISNCEKSPVSMSYLQQAEKLDGTSSFINNTKKYIEINDVTVIRGEFTVNKIDVPYLFNYGMTIEEKFNVQPGVTFVFASGNGITIQADGSLNAIGTASDRIIFTGKAQTPGCWYGIYIYTNLNNIMDYCTVEYAAQNDQNLWMYTDAKLDIRNTIISHSYKYGISLGDNSSVTHENVVFEDCTSGNVYNYDTETVSETLP